MKDWIKIVDLGFAGRRTKYRIAVATSCSEWNPWEPATSSLYKKEKKLGRAKVLYFRGNKEMLKEQLCALRREIYKNER
jgi:hypothetical protein